MKYPSQSPEYRRAYYAANKDKILAKSRQWARDNPEKRKAIANRSAKKHYQAHRKRTTNNKIKAVEYMGGKCADCGVVYPPYVYDFHHVNPEEKAACVATLLSGKWDILQSELDKCVLICSNCHRERHYGSST